MLLSILIFPKKRPEVTGSQAAISLLPSNGMVMYYMSGIPEMYT